MSTLEKRLVAALTGDTPSSTIAALIAEAEAAIPVADKAAEAALAAALDPVASPDATKARAAMDDAAFTCARLRALLPRLQLRFAELQASEQAARWKLDYQQVKTKRDTLAQEYAERVPKLINELADLFGRAEATDKEVSRINGSAPLGEHGRLGGVELTARGLETFTRDTPSIGRELKLPDFEHSARMIWPPPAPPLSMFVAPVLPHAGGNWWQDLEERARELRAEQDRVATYYNDMARQREAARG